MKTQNFEQVIRQKRATMKLSVGAAILLTLVKTAAGFLTHSMSILASAADSLMDILVSSINLYALRESDRPADKPHPYGHGKVEHIAGLFQCFFMTLSVIYLVTESIKRLMHGTYLKDLEIGFGVMVFAILVTIALVARLKWISRRSRSLILETESLHYSSDFLTNFGVIAALLLARWTGQAFWDLVFSLLIAGYLSVSIFRIGRRAVNELMDHEPPKELQEEIKRFVLDFDPKIANIHDFRARLVGGNIFAEFHIVIVKENDFTRAHQLTEGLMKALKDKYPTIDLYIHYDPEGVLEPKRGELPD